MLATSFLTRATSGTTERFLRFAFTSKGSSRRLKWSMQNIKCGKAPGKRELHAWASLERGISCTFRWQPKQAERFVPRCYWGNVISAGRARLRHISVCIRMSDTLRNTELMDSLFLILSRHGRIQDTGTETRDAVAITIPSISVTLGIR